MPSPDQPIPIPPLLSFALGTLAAVLLLTLAPAAWRVPGMAMVVAVVGLLWHREALRQSARAAKAERSTLRGEHELSLETLRGRAESLRAVYDAVPTPTLVISSDGRVARVNPAAGSLLGLPEPELVSRELEELFPQQELLTLFDQARLGTPALARLRLVLGSNPKFFDVSATPVPAGLFAGPEAATPAHRYAVVLSLEDVTTLAESVRLKTDFAANASHELRTPIAAIRGAVETLVIAADDPEMAQKLTGIIARHAARLEDLVADLLDLSRLEGADTPPVTEPVDLGAMVSHLESHTQKTRDTRDVGLDFEFAPSLSGLHLDPGLLELILRNLVGNACKFAHPGTVVRVEGSPFVPAGDPPPSGLASSQPEGLRILVIDRGQGIPLIDQERVFERFFQVDPGRDAQRENRGTGLGLAIVKHAVRRLDGRVEIQSVLGEGTTVIVEVPECIRPGNTPDSHN